MAPADIHSFPAREDAVAIRYVGARCLGPAAGWPDGCAKEFGHPGSHRRPIEERFWSKVQKGGPDECWPWLGALVSKGYGHLNGNDGAWVRAHRLSFEIAHGRAVAPGMFVCHRCDNPACVNPAHLFEGTNADNMQDCSRKGRLKTNPPDNRGERNGMAKLTKEMVEQIRAQRAMGRTWRGISRELGVPFSTVYHAGTGRAWGMEEVK